MTSMNEKIQQAPYRELTPVEELQNFSAVIGIGGFRGEYGRLRIIVGLLEILDRMGVDSKEQISFYRAKVAAILKTKKMDMD